MVIETESFLTTTENQERAYIAASHRGVRTKKQKKFLIIMIIDDFRVVFYDISVNFLKKEVILHYQL